MTPAGVVVAAVWFVIADEESDQTSRARPAT
jgi:hypothetical protein